MNIDETRLDPLHRIVAHLCDGWHLRFSRVDARNVAITNGEFEIEVSRKMLPALAEYVVMDYQDKQNDYFKWSD